MGDPESDCKTTDAPKLGLVDNLQQAEMGKCALMLITVNPFVQAGY